MTNTTTNLGTKPGFWTRVWIMLQEMEKTSIDHQWEAMEAIRAENMSLKQRVVQLEAASQGH